MKSWAELKHIAGQYEKTTLDRPGVANGPFIKLPWDVRVEQLWKERHLEIYDDPRIVKFPAKLTNPFYEARLALMDSAPVESNKYLPFVQWSAVQSALSDQIAELSRSEYQRALYEDALLFVWNDLFEKLCYSSDNTQPRMQSHGVQAYLPIPLKALIPYYKAVDLIRSQEEDIEYPTIIEANRLRDESLKLFDDYIKQHTKMYSRINRKGEVIKPINFEEVYFLHNLWSAELDTPTVLIFDPVPGRQSTREAYAVARKKYRDHRTEVENAAKRLQLSAQKPRLGTAVPTLFPKIFKRSSDTVTVTPTKPLSVDTPESEYPQPIWDLYHKAFKIQREKSKAEQPLTDDDVKTILDLFQQTGFTSAPRTWASLLAEVYESDNHSFTDHGKARELRVQTAFRPIGEVEAFNLAQSYLYPPPGGEIDNVRAVYWLAVASSQFEEARSLAVRLINYHEELKPLRVHLPVLVSQMSYDLDDPEELRTDNGHFLARAHNAGLYGLPADQVKAQAYYHAVATRDVNWSPRFHPAGLKPAKRAAALAAATRSLLGINTTLDPESAKAYATILFDDCDADDISHANERRAAIRIQHLADTMLDVSQSQQTQNVLAVAQAIIDKRMSPGQLVEALQSGAVASSALLEGSLSLLNTYLDDECVGYPSYVTCIAFTQMQMLGHKEIHFVENQFRYNAVDATQRPILGAIETVSAENASRQGFGNFRGLSVTATGEINFAFDPATAKHLPLIVPEDIEVALALAFGDSKPIWPAFSAEPPAPLTPTSPNWIPFTAQWMPQWLGHTALGNTLFATDCEAGPLALSHIANVQIAAKPQNDLSLARLKGVVDNMAAVELRHGGHGNFLTFRVVAVELTWSQSEGRMPQCTVDKTVVGLQTGTFDEHDTRTYTDNKDFATGYQAAQFNANYDLFAEHYPLLERYRQLATLVTALNQLRERGFEPASPIRKAIAESYNSFVRRPPPAQAGQLFL